ncbi:MAG: FtsW/RodA/SpoVE family cell cycle protein [Saprospiraceae bacterium]|nr:FtsW/RodA/SpoVE family cell cycle protein [Saprospiraceae bacterium]
MRAISNTLENLKGDKTIWFLVALLGLCSILAVYSAVGSMAYKSRGGNTEYYLIQQIVFIGIGFLFMYLSYKFNYMVYAKLAPILFLLAIPLLMYTIGFGTEINAAKRWITIPWIDKTFQTSDLARLALIIYIARSIAKRQDVIKDFKSAFLPIIIPIVIVCMLIAPADLSTAALLFATCLLMMIVGRVSMQYILVLVVVGIAAFSLLILIGSFFPEFVRLETWISRINEFMYNSDGGWQIQQSKIAIANGEIFGMGPGNSMQRNYLPYPYADFIYAIICEEYGLIGAITVIGIYVALLYRCVCMVTKCPKTFGSILAIGLCLNIVIQAFANIAVSVHLVPVTGLTLPIISMGGTSVVFTCIALGIILSVSKYVEEYSNYEILEEEAAVAEVEPVESIKSNRPKYENYY